VSAIGLCESCRHVQIIQNNRGSKFYLCLRANEDVSFAKYPRLPVLSCRGYDAADDSTSAEAGTQIFEKKH